MIGFPQIPMTLMEIPPSRAAPGFRWFRPGYLGCEHRNKHGDDLCLSVYRSLYWSISLGVLSAV